MNENKTIKINPELFNLNKNLNKNKTSKNKPIVSSNKLKQKFLNKIKEHKNKEINDFKIKIKTNIHNDNKKENGSSIDDNKDDFKNSLDYLTKLSSSNKTIKNNNNKININDEKKSPLNYNIDNIVPFGCLKNGLKPCYRNWKTLKRSQYRPRNQEINKNNNKIEELQSIKKSNDFLGKDKFNIRINHNDLYKINEKDKLKNKNLNIDNSILNINQLDLDIGDLDLNIDDLNTDTDLNTDNENTDTDLNTDADLNINNFNVGDINTHIVSNQNLNICDINTNIDTNQNLNIRHLDSCNMNNINNNNNNNLEIEKNNYNDNDNHNKVFNVPIKQTIKKTTIKKYTLGKNKIKKKVEILIKNHQTRKNIMEAHKLLKNKPIIDVKKYLQKHNLIKCGSKCPTDVLRKIYESAILSGNVINNNKELLIHNIQNQQL